MSDLNGAATFFSRNQLLSRTGVRQLLHFFQRCRLLKQLAPAGLHAWLWVPVNRIRMICISSKYSTVTCLEAGDVCGLRRQKTTLRLFEAPCPVVGSIPHVHIAGVRVRLSTANAFVWAAKSLLRFYSLFAWDEWCHCASVYTFRDRRCTGCVTFDKQKVYRGNSAFESYELEKWALRRFLKSFSNDWPASRLLDTF